MTKCRAGFATPGVHFACRLLSYSTEWLRDNDSRLSSAREKSKTVASRLDSKDKLWSLIAPSLNEISSLTILNHNEVNAGKKELKTKIM